MADELRTVLGFDASSAIASLAQMEARLQSWSAAMDKAVASASRFNSVAKGFSNNVKSSTGGLNQLSAGTSKLSSNMNSASASANKVAKSLSAIEKQAKLTYGKLATPVPFIHPAMQKQQTAVQELVTQYGTGMSSIEQSTKAAYGKLASTIPSIHPVMQKQKETVTALGKAYKKNASDMVLSWKSVIRIFSIQLIHQAISKVASSLAQAGQEARKFELALSEIQTISTGAFSDLDALADKVQELASASGIKLPVVSEALYQTLSNQVTDAGHALEFLASAADFSIASVSSLDSAVQLLSSVINSYKLEASSADNISGKLFKTIELGRIRADEIGTTFGRITVLSAQLGISLDEVLASMATLTRTGMRYNEAYTLITNTQLKLISPTENLKKVFSDLGVASAEAGIQAFGFQGFIQKIGETAGSTATELSDLYGRIRAVRGALGLGADYADIYNDSLEQIQKAGADTVAEAKELVFETNAQQVELELNNLNIALTNFGRGVTSVMLSTFNAFGGATGTVRTLTTTIAASATAWYAAGLANKGFFNSLSQGVTASIARMATMKGAMTEIGVIFKSLIKSPVFWAAAVGAAVVAINYSLNLVVKAAKEAEQSLEQLHASEKRATLARVSAELDSEKRYHSQYIGQVQKMLFERQKLFEASSKNISLAEKMMFSSLDDQVGSRISSVTGLFDSLQDKLRETAQTIKDINININQVSGSISDWNFDRSLRSIDKYHETYQRIARSEQLRAEATRAARAGEFEVAEALQKRAETQAKAAVSSADETKNRSLVAKAEQEANLAMKSQLEILKQRKQDATDQASLIKDQVSSMRQLSATMKVAGDQWKDLSTALQKTSDPVDRERILKDMSSIAKDIDRMFSDIKIYASISNKAELQKEFAEAAEAFFDPLTGEVSTLESAALDSARRIKTAYAGAFDTSELQKTAVALQKQIDEGANAFQRQTQSSIEMRQALELAEKKAATFTAEIRKQQRLTGSLATIFGDVELSTAQNLYKTVQNIVKEAQSLADSGRSATPEYAALLEKLRQIQQVLVTTEPAGPDFLSADLKPAAGIIGEVIEKLSEVPQRQKEINDAARESEVFETLRDKIQQSIDPINEYFNIINKASGNTGSTVDKEISGGMGRATSAVESGANAQISALKRVEEQARRTAAALAASGGTGMARGGLVYRAGGGFIPRGTDTVPAMLSPGEFVVNAKSARQFYSQLVAMNSGRTPAYKAAGGPVTNIDIGDIKITEAKSPSKTARETVSEIKRELRRQSSSLGGY